MRILVVTQYFWPENFKINDLCLGLKERGHEVTVLTGLPNYPQGDFFKGYSFFKTNTEYWQGIKVYRSRLIPRGSSGIMLMLNYFSFAFFSTLKGIFLKESFDKILVYEPSPITVGIPAMAISKIKKIPYYFWVQDLWPESLVAAGGIKNKLVLRLFDKITRLIYAKSEKILIQSEGFKEYILNQGVEDKKLVFFPNSTESFYSPKQEKKDYTQKLPSGFKLMFAGNLGEAQSLPTILEAANIVKHKNVDIKWIFLGDGRMKSSILQKIKENDLSDHVYLLGAYPNTEMPEFFACANALIVSLKKDKIFSLTIPSKLQSYMACGKPILASLDGEGARIVEVAKCGFTSAAQDSEGLAKNVLILYEMSVNDREKLGKNGRQYFENEFEREMLLTKLLQILN